MLPCSQWAAWLPLLASPGARSLPPVSAGISTQQQLADILGVDRKTVDNWENGRTTPRNRTGALVEWAPELGGEGR